MPGILLMTNILGLKRSGRSVNIEKDLLLVRKAIEMLHALRMEYVSSNRRSRKRRYTDS